MRLGKPLMNKNPRCTSCARFLCSPLLGCGVFEPYLLYRLYRSLLARLNWPSLPHWISCLATRAPDSGSETSFWNCAPLL